MSRKAMLIALVAVIAAVGVSSLFKRASVPGRTTRSVRSGELQVLPAQAHANSELIARIAGAKGRNAEVATCTWYRNGVPIPGVTLGTLSTSYFSHGDEIAVEAVTVPGQPAQRSAPVTILNSRPEVVTAMALQRGEGAEVYLQMYATDNDGDELTYTYSWFRNGSHIAGATAPTLDVSGFREGDKMYARVVANDGEDTSTPFNSSPMVLSGNALVITSTPPGSAGEGRYQYQVTTTQAEPGSLHYQLAEAPNGMTIDHNGLLDWTLPQDLQQVVVHYVEVRVSDDSGTVASQRFSITTGPMTQASAGR